MNKRTKYSKVKYIIIRKKLDKVNGWHKLYYKRTKESDMDTRKYEKYLQSRSKEELRALYLQNSYQLTPLVHRGHPQRKKQLKLITKERERRAR